jgi:hypothetical protein
MYALFLFTFSFFSITYAVSVVTRSQASLPLLPNSVGPVTNLTISNWMIAPDGYLRSYVAFLLLVPSY